MNTAHFCQFHDVWGNKWSFCSEEKETGTTNIVLSSLALWNRHGNIMAYYKYCKQYFFIQHNVGATMVKLWLLIKITNYWHLKFFLLTAPKRGWHLCGPHLDKKKWIIWSSRSRYWYYQYFTRIFQLSAILVQILVNTSIPVSSRIFQYLQY